MRKILIGIVVLLLALVAAAFFGPRFIPADSLKAEISEQVRAATGRELIIDGDLSFTLLPAPGVTVSGVRVSNIEGAQAADMLQLGAAQIVVALGPLITGTVEIERVVLVEPVLELEQLADGTDNWTFAPSETAAADTGDGGGAIASSGRAASIQLNDLVVRDGTVVFRNPAITERIDGINASFGAASLLGPFRAEGDLVVRGMAARVNAAIGELEFEQAIPVSVSGGVGESELSFSGLLSGFPNQPRVAGELEGKTDNLANLVAAVSGEALPGGLAASPLAIKGDLEADTGAVALNNLSLAVAGINATGAANAALGETPEIDLILNVGQLDLDKVLADFQSGVRKASGAPARAGGAPAGGQKTGPTGSSTAAAPEAAFALPTSLDATIETKIDALLYRGGVVRQAALIAQLADGELTISQLTAQLPGSADVSLFGFVTARDGLPAFGGQGEANADDLRGLLTWLGADVSAVPLDRLRKLALTAKLDGVPEQLNITDIDLGIDGSRIRGGVAVALRERLGLGIGLSIDKLNIDAYLPEVARAPAPAGGAAPATGQPRSGRIATPPGQGGLAFLGGFDSVLQLKAGALTYRGKSIQGLNIDGTLAAGSLDLRDASVKSLAGARVKASGRLEGVATPAPTADLNLAVEAAESDRLLEMFGVAPEFTVGPGRLQGSVKGNLDLLDIDLTVAALDAELATKGKVSPLKSDPEFDLSMDLSHGDAKALFDRVGGNGTAGATGRSPDALRVAAAATGSLAKSAFSAGVTIGAGSFAVKGQVSGAGTEQMSGGVSLSGKHPDLANAVRIFVPDYRPALAEPGPLDFSTDLAFDPTTLRLDNLRGNAGPVAFESTASVALDRVRPRIAGELRTSEIIVDWFLPAQKRVAPAAGTAGAPAGAGRQPARAPAGGARWSNDRLDFSALHAIDGEIAFTAPALTYTDLKVDKPKITLQLADGVLDLRELSGRAYGGNFNMTGQVAANEVPSLRYAISIDGADAAQFTGAAGQQGGRGVMTVLDLLFPVSDVRLVSGTLGAKIDVGSRGSSERELIGALSGNGSVTFTNAVAEGVDVCRVSNQLDNLNGLEGFLGLIISAQGGRTRIANYAGQFDIANGVATLPRQRINADCATIDFAGNVDLPRWQVDLQAKALFPQHPEFPGVVVEQKGQLDKPNTRFVNSNQVQQYIIARSAGSVLRKLVPKEERPPAPAQPGTAPTQPAPAPEPVEQFRNLLDDLIRKR